MSASGRTANLRDAFTVGQRYDNLRVAIVDVDDLTELIDVLGLSIRREAHHLPLGVVDAKT